MDDNKTLTLIDVDGNKKEYEILITFMWSKNKKNYIVYTDNTYDVGGNLNIYASIYYPDDDTKLEEIKTEEEWKLIESSIKKLQEGSVIDVF